jgi:transcription termination/antitermination protein NusG
MELYNESTICKEYGSPTFEKTTSLCTEWFVAFVASGKEEKIKAFLNLKFSNYIKAYVPRRMLRERKNGVWHNIARTLFPGYIFLNGNIKEEEYYELRNVPGLWKIFKYGNDLLPIPASELNLLLYLINQGKPIEQSYMLKTDKEITVVDGPLMGMEGNIIRIDHRKGRAKVKLIFLGEERRIDFAVEFLKNKPD